MLDVQDLGCERGGRMLFRGLSFALHEGELLRVAGANGSGKTSLLRILCGLLGPGTGEVRWKGAAIGTLKEDYSTQLVYLGHAPGLKEDFTAIENLMFTWVLSGKGMPVPGERLTQALHKLEVPMTTPARKLSQGQRRRAVLARLALSEGQPLWLLDEPFAALDTGGAEVIEALVSAHLQRGGMVVYTTHQASRMAGREIRLDA